MPSASLPPTGTSLTAVALSRMSSSASEGLGPAGHNQHDQSHPWQGSRLQDLPVASSYLHLWRPADESYRQSGRGREAYNLLFLRTERCLEYLFSDSWLMVGSQFLVRHVVWAVL